jgi:Uma2 family endonuclease
MAAQPQPLTPEQYLKIERAAQCKSEYYNGRMYAMAGASATHVLITGNLTGETRNALKGRGCLVFASDLRVRVSPAGLYTYPDLAVVCDQPKYADNDRDTLLNPIVIVEVLSPSTEGYDRGFKFAQYRRIESLQEYVLVSQTEPCVEVFRRQPGGNWLLAESAGLDAACRLESLDCGIALSEIYAGVTFGEDETPSPRPSPGA